MVAILFKKINLVIINRCIFLQRNPAGLINCMHRWRQLTPVFCYKDVNLQLHVYLIASIIFVSAILENLSFYWKVKAVHGNVRCPWDSINGRKSIQSIQATYWSVHHYNKFTDLIQYNATLSTFLFVFNKLCVYVWNFGDILFIIMSKALYMRLYLHYKASKMECKPCVIAVVLHKIIHRQNAIII